MLITKQNFPSCVLDFLLISKKTEWKISFGKSIEGTAYKVLDERQIRASSGIMFLLGLIAFINGFIMEQYQIIPYVSGFLLVNFLLGVFFNPAVFAYHVFGSSFCTQANRIAYWGHPETICLEFGSGAFRCNLWPFP